MELITSRLEDLDEYAGEVQARVRAELGALSIPPQHEGVILENDEKRNEHYKKVTEILMTRASKDAEACIPEADTLETAERLLAIRTAELERLKLEKSDPELGERQWQMLADLKARLVEYPTFLGEVTGDQTFLQNIKRSYESKLEELEKAIDKLTDDIFGLDMTCSSRVETSLEKFAEQTMKPAISIVSAQHERLEKELGEAEMRIEKMEAQAGDAGTEKKRLEDEIVELKKILEAEREVKKTQNEEHKRETIDLKARHEKARTIAAEEASSLRADISSYVVAAQELNGEKEELEDSVKRWREQNDSRREELNQLRAKLRTKERELREAQSEVDSVKEGLQKARDEVVVVDERAEQEKESLRNELKAVKEARNSADAQIQSISSQLATARNEIDSLRELKARDVRSLEDQLSTEKSEKHSLQQSHERQIQALQELEINYGRATTISGQRTRLLQWHISKLDNVDMGESESEDVLGEMGAIIGTMERYAGPRTEAVSMPKQVPELTLVWKAMAIPESNLAAARQLWLSSRCDSLALDVARAFFTQQDIRSAQFALLPWIHASLNRAVITMCERSTVTPDLASALLCILRGLIYTATVTREWSEDHAWIPKVEEMLTKINIWLGEHVPNDEASILMMVVNQVNDIVYTHESPTTSMSPNDFEESQRIDSANSDVPNGMAMVFDKSGMIILFTADNNAFVFGASEVKVVETDSLGNMVFIFESQLAGLPENLREIRLHDCGEPKAIKSHKRMLRSLLPKGRVVVVSVKKYWR